MINFLLDTGVRVSEFCNLRISDINFDEKYAIVFGKGDKERTVYFSDKTLVRLLEYISYRKNVSQKSGQMIYYINTPLFCSYRKHEKPLKPEAVQRELKRIGKKSGVTRIHPHLLRATFATNLAIKGVSIEIIAKLLGHANLHTVDRYILMNDEKIKNTIQKIM